MFIDVRATCITSCKHKRTLVGVEVAQILEQLVAVADQDGHNRGRLVRVGHEHLRVEEV